MMQSIFKPSKFHKFYNNLLQPFKICNHEQIFCLHTVLLDGGLTFYGEMHI
jgi:hypothetical protein